MEPTLSHLDVLVKLGQVIDAWIPFLLEKNA